MKKNEAKIVVWGSGNPYRKFLHVDDWQVPLFLMEQYNEKQFINVGFGKDISIKKLTSLIKELTQYHSQIESNTAKPEGTLKKLMDNSRINELGWRTSINLLNGITSVYQ